jgi:hypothetical protein
LIFTTAGKTFATAKTAGSEAGSACAKQAVDPVKISSESSDVTSVRHAYLGSARAPRAIFGAFAENTLSCRRRTEYAWLGRQALHARARALPRLSEITLIIAL